MSSFDNEIYRGPPEAGPTLERDIRSYGSDVYILKAEKNTLAQDVPPTEEPVRQETKPVQKKESRLSKAMKLLASCTAAVAVAATLTTAPAVTQEVDAVWPGFGPISGTGSWSFNPVSQNSNVCQTSIGGKSFRLEAQQEGIHLQWHESYLPSTDGSQGGFYVCMENIPENWTAILDFNVTPQSVANSDEALGQITTATGDTLYVRGFYMHNHGTAPTVQDLMNNLDAYIHITEATADGWGKVLIGESMYSDTFELWNGIQYLDPWNQSSWEIRHIYFARNAGFSPDSLVCQYRVNGIDWSFYTSLENGEFLLWAVPHQEDIAFAKVITHVLWDFGIDPAVMAPGKANAMQTELSVAMRTPLLREVGDYISTGLQYYHLTEQYISDDLQLWPQLATWSNFATYSIQPASLRGTSCQVSLGDTALRFEAMGKNIYLYAGEQIFFESTTGDAQPTCGFSLYIQDTFENTMYRLNLTQDSLQESVLGIIQVTDGQPLYITDCVQYINGFTHELLSFESLNRLVSLLQVTPARDDGWGMLQLGDDLITETNIRWNGLYSTDIHREYFSNAVNPKWSILRIQYSNTLDMSRLEQIRSEPVNGLTWSFYWDRSLSGLWGMCMWAIPDHGGTALLLHCHPLVEYLRTTYYPSDSAVDLLPIAIDWMIEDGLRHIHPLTNHEPSNPHPTGPMGDPDINVPPETTLPPETEPILPEPYPEMAEYVHYTPRPDFIVGSPFARSNRACQFVTEHGAYRLRAQVPELFIHWESYFYDVKDESANSLISFNHYEEDWHMEAWVFEHPVDSMFQGFSMTMSNGQELWFYVDSNRSSIAEADLPAAMQRLSDLVKLSPARDDGWNPVRIGQTLISDTNQYWNGLSYTTSDFDYWYFEQILTGADLEGYELRHQGTRTINGIDWDFYTYGSASGYTSEDGRKYYYTRVFATPAQEDIWLATALSYGLSPSQSEFASQAEYETWLDGNIAYALDIIASQGLSHYHLYP